MNTYIKHSDILQPYTTNKFVGNLIEDWTPGKKIDFDIVAKAMNKAGNKIHLRVFPRRMVKTVWADEQPSVSFPKKSYAFRAFARGNQITLFDDDTETSQSLSWLLLHEMAHVMVTRTDKLRTHFRSIERPVGYMVSDSAHESSPEEQFANMMADQWFKEFYGKPGSFHRVWWRKQVTGK